VFAGFVNCCNSILIVDFIVDREVIAYVYWTPVILISLPLKVQLKGFGIAEDTSLPQPCRNVLRAVIVTVYGIFILNSEFSGMSPEGSIVKEYLLGTRTLPEVDDTVKVCTEL
jgi:hypothetical protein